MLKKSASFVLASLNGSTLSRSVSESGTLDGSFRSPRPITRANGRTKCGTYLLASSLAAALSAEWRVLARRGRAGEKSGLFEHSTGAFLLSVTGKACRTPKLFALAVVHRSSFDRLRLIPV